MFPEVLEASDHLAVAHLCGVIKIIQLAFVLYILWYIVIKIEVIHVHVTTH